MILIALILIDLAMFATSGYLLFQPFIAWKFGSKVYCKRCHQDITHEMKFKMDFEGTPFEARQV